MTNIYEVRNKTGLLLVALALSQQESLAFFSPFFYFTFLLFVPVQQSLKLAQSCKIDVN